MIATANKAGKTKWKGGSFTEYVNQAQQKKNKKKGFYIENSYSEAEMSLYVLVIKKNQIRQNVI